MALTRIGLNQSINLASNVTGTLPIANGGTALTSGFVNGGVNTPSFLVRKNGDFGTVSASTWTKITGWAEIFDPQSTFASDKFTPGVAGKYFIYGYVYLLGISGERFLVGLYKSGTRFVESGSMASAANNYPQLVCGYADLSDTDYIELYFNSPGGNSNAYSSGITVQWGGYKIIE
jgi:hypothetical protein